MEHLMQLRAAYSQGRIRSLLSDKLTHASVLQELINILQAIGGCKEQLLLHLLACLQNKSKQKLSLIRDSCFLNGTFTQFLS
jgi:hypothetical protein